MQVQFEYRKEHGKGNISLPNKIPLVLPFEGFSPMTKQVTNKTAVRFKPRIKAHGYSHCRTALLLLFLSLCERLARET